MTNVKDFFAKARQMFAAHTDRFANNEDGMELLQVVIIIIIALITAGVVYGVVSSINSKLETVSQNEIENMDFLH